MPPPCCAPALAQRVPAQSCICDPRHCHCSPALLPSWPQPLSVLCLSARPHLLARPASCPCPALSSLECARPRGRLSGFPGSGLAPREPPPDAAAAPSACLFRPPLWRLRSQWVTMREARFLPDGPGPSSMSSSLPVHTQPPPVSFLSVPPVYEHLDVLVSVCTRLSLCTGPEAILVTGGSRLVAGLSTAPAPGLRQVRLIAENLAGVASTPGPFAPRIGQSGAGTVASGPFRLHSAVCSPCGPSVRWRLSRCGLVSGRKQRSREGPCFYQDLCWDPQLPSHGLGECHTATSGH